MNGNMPVDMNMMHMNPMPMEMGMGHMGGDMGNMMMPGKSCTCAPEIRQLKNKVAMLERDVRHIERKLEMLDGKHSMKPYISSSNVPEYHSGNYMI